PAIICSEVCKQEVGSLLAVDEGLPEVERAYKERLAAARALIAASDPDSAPWPPDLPRPNGDRNAFDDPQYKVAYDLTCLAVAFVVFHEFKHVMFDRNGDRPIERREEELLCDVWAREFM